MHIKFPAMAKYIYQHKNWTDFTWQDKAINAVFGEVRLMQGKIIGQMNALGFYAKEEVTLTALTLDVVKSFEIEGELLSYEQVRFSIARRLGINTAGFVPGLTPYKSDFRIDGSTTVFILF